MRWLAISALVVVSALMSPMAASGKTFGDWASGNGYRPGAVMPKDVSAIRGSIDSLDGIGDFDWTTTPTTDLNLHWNQLSSIEAGAFSGLTYLTSLGLSNNQISNIQSVDISELTNLKRLNLWYNQISSVEASDFDGLTKLEWLDLGLNQISSMEDLDFSGLTNLRTLWLGDNPLSSIEAGDFSGLTNLRELGFASGQISNIDASAFSGLANLWRLELGGNQLSSIDAGDFDGLPNLTSLWVGSNPLSSIEPGAFNGLDQLEWLRLEGNEGLTELNLTDANFSSLTRFDVEGNVNMTRVSLKNSVVNQTSLARLLDGGIWPFGNFTGIGELDGITEIDLSGVDFANVTDLEPLYVMDDLTDLWLVNTQNLDALGLDELLDNLATIQGTNAEGVLYMTQADFDAFNTAGGELLAAWDAEPGHHVAIVPEPTTSALLLSFSSIALVCSRMRRLLRAKHR